MYCGDETGGVVGHVGAHTARFGYAGEDMPKADIPSAMGTGGDGGEQKGGDGAGGRYRVGTPALRHYMDNVAVASPVHQGNVTDWDGMEALWTHAMKNTLSVDLQEHPVLLVLSSFASDDTQAKYVQMMFETFNPPALFVCKEAVMVAFASGRSTALVLDSGHSHTQCVPVQDGYVLGRAQVRSSLAGQAVTERLHESLLGRGVDVRPHYAFKRVARGGAGRGGFDAVPVERESTHPSFATYHTLDVVRDIKECVCQMPMIAYNDAVAKQVIPSSYELPDGTVLKLGTERFEGEKRREGEEKEKDRGHESTSCAVTCVCVCVCVCVCTRREHLLDVYIRVTPFSVANTHFWCVPSLPP